ncbi:MAG: NAD(P)-binding domain-containing protein [Ignavibacteriales bacterium]|nr:NAD(P)-binding domain-containing protein [Ignavibacteriales bacterium]
MEKLKVGFIGTGMMGSPMAKRLLDAGYSLFVYNRSQTKTESLVKMAQLYVIHHLKWLKIPIVFLRCLQVLRLWNQWRLGRMEFLRDYLKVPYMSIVAPFLHQHPPNCMKNTSYKRNTSSTPLSSVV